jgi:hypothetical protein
MKAIHIIVILILVSGISTGIYFHQKDKQKKALAAHNQKKFQQLTEASQKSSSAGLLVLASAINKYHQKKGYYPKGLTNLYPDFISDKQFISSLNWEYKAERNSYLVKRQIAGQNVVSSMGPDLKLKIGTLKKESSPQKTHIAATSQAGKKPAAPAPVREKPVQSLPQKEKMIANILPQPGKPLNTQKKQPPEPEYILDKKELGKNEEYLKRFNTSGLYIWKSNEGFIGFSNIQFPDKKELTIFQDKRWVVYQDSKPKQIPVK